MIVSLLAFLLLIQTPVEPVFRVRLFSATPLSGVVLTPEGGSPRQLRAIGMQLTADGRVVSSPLRTRGTAVLRPSGREAVRTPFPLEISAKNGLLMVVALIPREDYVAGVLAGEASVFRSEESLKAMAVASRTYAMHFVGRHKSEAFDFCDTTHCQDYRGVAITARARKAASDTAGEILWHEGTPIEAYYHQDCGGTTERQSSYLPEIHDAFCVSDGRMQWTAELSAMELELVSGIRNVRHVEIVSRTPSGRVSHIQIIGSGARTLEAEAFRLGLGRAIGWNRMRSDLYEVRRKGDAFVFEGYGAGHGIGLCQNGAAAMGDQGHSYREILAYYYPTTVVGVRAAGIPWIKFSGGTADLETTRSQDTSVLDIAGRLMRGLEESTARRFKTRPMIRIYPTVAAYRDDTGEPGWMAASTKNNVIRLQPAETLRSRNALDSTLKHELAHLLVEAYARNAQPLWFREGLVLWLSQPASVGSSMERVDLAALERALARPESEAQLRQSYRVAQQVVEKLVRERGRQTVLSWIERGLPEDVAR